MCLQLIMSNKGHCSVPFCSNNRSKGQLGITFGRFPVDKYMKKSWIIRICRDVQMAIAMLGSRLTGLRFFHVIAFAGPARLIKLMRVQNQARSGFPRFITSTINWAGSPHVFGGLYHGCVISCIFQLVKCHSELDS